MARYVISIRLAHIVTRKGLELVSRGLVFKKFERSRIAYAIEFAFLELYG